MKAILIVLISVAITSISAYSPSFMRQPAVSPDGEMICFTYMSDLWTVPYEGGEAKRLTVSQGDDTTPVYSHDGEWIAFASDRNGFRGIYIIPSEGGKAQLVSKESYLSVSDWFQDNERLLGTRFKRGTGRGQYIIHLEGRRVEELTPISHHFSHLSPDERKIIFNQRGYPYRPAYQGSMAGNLWEYDIENDRYTQITFSDTTERYPLYSHVNPYIYFGGSDGEKFQLYRIENYNVENREQLTFFEDWSVRNISIARENDRLAFEKFDKIWRYDLDHGEAEKVDIVIKQDFFESFDIEKSYTNAADKFAVSDDGKLIAFSYKYDLFAMPGKGGRVKRITHDQRGIDDILIMPDNRTIYFLKRDRGSYQLFSVDINNPEQIIKNEWSEGKYIRHIYMICSQKMAIHYKIGEDNWRVALMNINTGQMTDIIEDDPVWSWFLAFNEDLDQAFYVTGNRRVGSRDLKLYDLNSGKASHLFSRLSYIGNLYMGHDQRFLFMTLDSDLVRLDLVPISDYTEITDNWDDILERAEEPESRRSRRDRKKAEAGADFKVKTQDIETRISTVSDSPGINFPVHIKSDSTLYYVNRDPSGYVYSLRRINYWGEEEEEIITLSGNIRGYTTAFKYNETNNHFYVVVDNQLININPAARRMEVVENEFDYEYNEIELNKSVFDEIWVEFGNNFYDPDMHGVDWEAMYEKFRPYVDHTYRADYLQYIVDEMIGNLDASHTGFTPVRGRQRPQTELAFIGCTFDYGNVLDEGIAIRDIYRGSTLYQKYGVREGDILLRVDDEYIDPYTTIGPLFEDKTGEQINVKIKTAGGIVDTFIDGLDSYRQYELYYEDLVIRRKEEVEHLSKEKIGYINIPRMRPERVPIFEEDLFAKNWDKKAVVIDIRGNSGGRISRMLLDILSRTSRAYTTSRGYPDEMFETPNRIWDRPIALLIDHTSFSDAEIFPILFRQKELGVVVGTPTGGGVIGTTPYTLMDGSTLRMPRSGWFTKEGVNMEGTGAQPDIFIEKSPENIIDNDDIQLQKAVEVLLEQLKE